MDEKEIELLIQLQSTDCEIDESIKKEQVLFSRLKQIEERLKRTKEDFIDKKGKLKNTKKEKMKGELQVNEIDGKLQRHEEDKYKVKTKQEFEALEREIANLEKQKDKEEDYLLELMEEEEELTDLLPSLEKQLNTNEEKSTKEKDDLNNQLVYLKKNRKSWIKKREELSSCISTTCYNQYEQLRRTREGLAVIMVKNEVCGGCNVKVPPSFIGQMKRCQIVYCESCSRIIYLGKRGEN